MVFLESAAVQWKKMERKRRSRRRKSDRKSKLQGNRRARIISACRRREGGIELCRGRAGCGWADERGSLCAMRRQ